MLFILCTFLVFRIEDYYSWHLTTIVSDDSISSKGYILHNNKESKITIYDFGIERIDINKNVKSMNIKLINKDLIIYDDTKYYDDKILNQDILNNFTLYVETNKKIDIKELELIIKIEYSDGYKDVIKTKY